MPEPTRKLAAIMFTDIAGYTALMGNDESKAMQLVRRNREVQKPLVKKYGGEWLKEMGDGTMTSFTTASDAVHCALEIQKTLIEDVDLNLRIGIHLGEVAIENGDIYGDGVNIASRLESIADSGGIYISDTVYKAIKSNSDILAIPLGDIELKNVDYPVQTYALRGEYLPIPRKTSEKKLSGRFIAELKRRNVVRAILTYLIFTFLIYNLLLVLKPEDTINFILQGFLLLGFPVSIYLAWNYERSPKGFVKVTSRESWENPFSINQKKPLTNNTFIIVLLVIAVSINVVSSLSNKQSQLNGTKGEDIAIAVMPFRNDSEEASNLYFCNGLMEDVTNQLSKIQGIRVPSVTSMLYYRDNPKPYSEIVKELNVSHLLEASIRKMENQAIMNITLIDANKNQRIWSDRLEMDLSVKSVFDIQFEVASAIAKNMQVALNEMDNDLPTESYEAYDNFMKARDLMRIWDTEMNRTAINYLHGAIQLDPAFQQAYAALGQAYGQRTELDFKNNWIDSAKHYSSIAYERNSEDAYTLNGLAYANVLHGEIEEGLKLYLKAYSVNKNAPNNYAGWCYQMLGGHVKAALWANRAIMLDPNNSISYIDMTNATNSIGLFAYTRYYGQKALDINPDLYFGFENLRTAEEGKGNYRKAMEHTERMIDLTEKSNDIAYKGILYYKMDSLEKAAYFLNINFEDSFNEDIELSYNKIELYSLYMYRALIKIKSGDSKTGFFEIEGLLNRISDNLNDDNPRKLIMLAGMHATLDNKKESIKLLEKAIERNFYDYMWYMNNDFLEPLKNEQEFQKILVTVEGHLAEMREKVISEGYLEPLENLE